MILFGPFCWNASPCCERMIARGGGLLELSVIAKSKAVAG